MTSSEINLRSWTTPDKLGGNVLNPQSFNRYAYVDNNPASFNDPLGLFLANPQTEYVIKTTSWGWPIMYDLLSPFDVMQRPIMPNLPGGFGQVGGWESPSTLTHPPKPNIITWPQLQTLVHQNNESNFCDNLIDCVVFKESTLDGGFNTNAVPLDSLGLPIPGATARGLMQMTRGATSDIETHYPSNFPSNTYNELFNPATNIQAGSAYLGLLVGRAGNVFTALTHYGGHKWYANDVVNCVIELELGNFSGAEAAAHGEKW